jgi:hypothetical protein
MTQDENPALTSDTYHVDPGALAIAVVVGGATFTIGAGPWDRFSIVVGAVLLIFLFAYYRHPPALSTPRDLLIRLAFGASVALAIGITLAPVIQSGIYTLCYHRDRDYLNVAAAWTTRSISVLWLPLALVFTRLESRIMDRLDKASTGKLWIQTVKTLAPARAQSTPNRPLPPAE